MIYKLSPKAYAQSIYSLTSQENCVSETIGDLKILQEKFSEFPSFYLYLCDPKLTLQEKEKNLRGVFFDFISKKTYRILLLLIKNKHLKWLNEIIDQLEKIKKIDEEILDAKIYVPAPLEENQKAKFKTILADKTNKVIIIQQIIDPNIIGGVKIDLGSISIDGSIAGKLEKLHKYIKNI